MSLKLGYEAIEFAIRKWMTKNTKGIASIPGQKTKDKIKILVDKYADQFRIKGQDVNTVTVKQVDNAIDYGMALKKQQTKKEALKAFPPETHKFFGRPLKEKDFKEIDKLYPPKKDPFQGFTPRVQQDVDSIIKDLKNMEPVAAMKEANLIIGRKGKYKNLSGDEAQRILKDTDDHIFQRDIKYDEFGDPIKPDPEDLASGGIARVGFAGGLLAKLYKGVKGLQHGAIERKLRQKYGKGFEAYNKAMNEATEIVNQKKLKIVENKMNEVNIGSDDYVDLIDESIRLTDREMYKDIKRWKNTRPDLADKTRALHFPDWAAARYGEDYQGALNKRQASALKQKSDEIDKMYPDTDKDIGPSFVGEQQMVDEIDEMNKANIDEIIGGRKKNATGGMARVALGGGKLVLEGLKKFLQNKKTVRKAVDDIFPTGDYKYDAEMAAEALVENNPKFFKNKLIDDLSDAERSDVYGAVLSEVQSDFAKMLQMKRLSKPKKTLEGIKKKGTIDISDPEVADEFSRFMKESDPKGYKDLEQKVDLSNLDIKGKKGHASGGIAGQLHMNEGGRTGFHRGSLRHQKEHDYKSYEDEGNFMKYLLLSGDRAKSGPSPEGGVGPYSWLSADTDERMGYDQWRDDFETMMKERFMYGEHKPPSNFEQIWADIKGLLKKKDEKKASGGIAGQLHLNEGGRVPMIFGGSAGLKAMWRALLKALNKGRKDKLKTLFPKYSTNEKKLLELGKKYLPRDATNLAKTEKTLKAEGIDVLIDKLKHDKKLIERQAKNKAMNDPGLNFLMKDLEKSMSEAYTPHLKKYTNIDKDILQMETIKKNLIMKGRKLNAKGGIAGELHLNRPGYAKGSPHTYDTGGWELATPDKNKKRRPPKEGEELRKDLLEWLKKRKKVEDSLELSKELPQELPPFEGPPYEGTNNPNEAAKEIIRRYIGSGVMSSPITGGLDFGVGYGENKPFDYGFGYNMGEDDSGLYADYGIRDEGENVYTGGYKGDNWDIGVRKEEGGDPYVTFKKKLKKKPKILGKAKGGRVSYTKGGLAKILGV